MCTVSEYVGIKLHKYAEIVVIYTTNLMYYDAMEEKTKARILKAFPSGSVI